MERIRENFFEQDPVTCARGLIGCHFVWHGCVGRIVETEAYDATGDAACHTWFRPSARTFVEAGRAGDAYVYMNYGVHWLFNVLVKGGPRSGFVLFRAVEPVSGIELMRGRRQGVKDPLLGAGPGRLTRAFGIDGAAHGGGFLSPTDSDRVHRRSRIRWQETSKPQTPGARDGGRCVFRDRTTIPAQRQTCWRFST